MNRTATRQAAALAAVVVAVTAATGPALAAAGPAPVAPVVSTATATAATPPLATPVRGQDISWPECPKSTDPLRPGQGKPMPASSAKFVIVGMTTGTPFKPNPCLASQAAWVKSHHVYAAPYAVIAYPVPALLTKYGHQGPYRGDTLNSRLRNVGWNEAQFNLASMRKVGLSAPVIWADVEVTHKNPWSSSRSGNKAVFDGVLAAYKAAGFKVGLYATRSQWASIMGSPRYGLAEWHTTGPSSLTTAKKACTATSFNGGRTVLAQWWTTLNDYNVMCPGYDSVAAMKQYFHKF